MSTLPWWVYSIIATVVWGLHFNLIVKVSSVLPRDLYTPITLFFITASSVWLVIPFVYPRVFANLQTIFHADPTIRYSALALIGTTIVAATLLNFAMQLSGNATLASLLDITYPLFVALIAWLVFRENHVDGSILLGGGLILLGSAIIIWKHG